MASRTVDVISLGPPPRDPYEPSATAWALAEAFAAEGDDVRVIRPEGPSDAAPPAGTSSVEVAVPLRRPGAASDQAAFAVAAGHRVRPAVDLIVRDPSGLGPLRPRGRTVGSPPIIAFIRSVELHAFDRERGSRSRGWVDRFDAWRDRRTVRRLELAAVSEADLLFADSPEVGVALAREYGVPAERLRSSVPPVADLPRPESRDAARASLDMPRDVPVAVVPAAEGRDASSLDRAREAFHRVRPLFPGARLIVAGASVPTDPGVLGVPLRDAASFGLALSAANVAMFAQGRPSFDPMVIGAMRAGCAVAAVPSVRLPVNPGGAVRYSASDDPGDLASTLAELFADPALVRQIAGAGSEYATHYLPSRLVQAIHVATAAPGR